MSYYLIASCPDWYGGLKSFYLCDLGKSCLTSVPDLVPSSV